MSKSKIRKIDKKGRRPYRDFTHDELQDLIERKVEQLLDERDDRAQDSLQSSMRGRSETVSPSVLEERERCLRVLKEVAGDSNALLGQFAKEVQKRIERG